MSAGNAAKKALFGQDGQPLSLDDPGPSWCAVANVVEDRPYGPGGTDIRHGTKHLAPGAKVFFAMAYWGMGAEKVTVIGRHRKANRFITLDLQSRYLENWRTKLAYSPHVTRILAERGEYTRQGHYAPASERAKQLANQMIAMFNMRCARSGQRHHCTRSSACHCHRQFHATRTFWPPDRNAAGSV